MRWKIVGIVIAVGAASAIAPRLILRHRSIVLEGAVMLKDSDPKRESPIAGVTMSVDPGDGVTPAESTTSTFSGYFTLRLRPTVLYGDKVTLRLRHADHQPLDMVVPVAEQLYVIHMSSNRADVPPRRPAERRAGDVVVRYTIENRTAMNIGSGVKTFQVVNRATSLRSAFDLLPDDMEGIGGGVPRCRCG